MVTKDKLIRIVEILGPTFYEVHTIKNGYIEHARQSQAILCWAKLENKNIIMHTRLVF